MGAKKITQLTIIFVAICIFEAAIKETPSRLPQNRFFEGAFFMAVSKAKINGGGKVGKVKFEITPSNALYMLEKYFCNFLARSNRMPLLDGV